MTGQERFDGVEVSLAVSAAKCGAMLTAAMAVGLVVLTGCGKPSGPPNFSSLDPKISPLDYFTGRASSFGVLESRGGAPTQWFTVASVGVRAPDGALRLDQTIQWGGAKVDHRFWIMRRSVEGRLSATLTDASGPVAIETSGPLLHLSYPMKSIPGGRMEQWLYLQSDTRTLLNEGSVTVFGVLVARLSERITKDQRL